MTTIVYRDGILAADTRAYSGDSSPIGYKQKIYACDDGRLIGVSTPQPGLSEQVVRWLMADPDEKADLIPTTRSDNGFQALEIMPDGDVYFYSSDLHPSGPLMAPWFAIGSGTDYAIGALVMGATATEAVDCAMQYDPWSGGDVVLLRLNSETGLEKAA